MEPLQITQSIKFLTPKKIQNITQEDLSPRKAPGYDLITGRILKEMPGKCIVQSGNQFISTDQPTSNNEQNGQW
jgi:hypothetical protein